jgi:predicted DNA binding CopG/RHH family protein
MPEEKKLRIRLSESNTIKVKKIASKDNTTPPRIVNKIVSKYRCNGK